VRSVECIATDPRRGDVPADLLPLRFMPSPNSQEVD
jgi:hypothetical protein